MKNTIAVAICAALASGTSFAEEVTTDAKEIEVITVSGIRGSLSKAVNTKRFSDGVVDVISSEDIGKFPDENVAESLQRLPGISIQRDKGEGKFISVRGLSPEFSPSTLNGRQVASGRTSTAAITAMSGGSTRAFAFNVLPSELVGGVEVYKSLSADLVEGGIGGLVEIKTRKPFDYDEQTLGGSLEASYDDKSGDTNPKGSFFFTDKNEDDSMGILVSASYSERTLREDQFWAWGWTHNGVDNLDTEGVDHPDGWFPWEDATTISESTSERLGVSAAFQWAISDELEFNTDVLYSNFDSDNTENRAAIRWTVDNNNPFGAYGATVDPATGGLTSASSTSAGMDDKPFEIVTTNELHSVETETIAVGANLAWTRDDLTVVGDISYSKAESASEYGNLRFRNEYNVDYTRAPGADLPSYDVQGDLLDAAAFTFLDAGFGSDPVTDETFAIRIDTNYSLDGDYITSIDAGVRYNVNEKDQYKADCNAACNIELSAMNLTLADVDTVTLPGGGFFEGEGVDLIRDFLVADTQKAINAYNLDDIEHEESISSIFVIKETTIAGYVKANYSLDTSIPISGNFGVRVVQTDMDSTGALPTKILIIDNIIVEQEGTFSTVSNSYTEVLPSATIKFDVSEEFVVRSSVAKALTRPDLALLSPKFNFNGAEPPSGSGGNPELDPFVSWNYDLSAEWYFSDIGYISGAVFYKDITGFVSTTDTFNETVAGQEFFKVSRPENTSDAKIKGLEFTWQQGYDFLPGALSGLGTIFNHTYIDSSTSFSSDYEPTEGQTAAPFEGLSDNTTNAVVFYENGPFSARIAYNYRSSYLENANLIFSSRSVDAYGQLDASVSYDINDNWTVTLDGTGLNEPRLKKYDAGMENLPSVIIDNGMRFFLGIRGQM